MLKSRIANIATSLIPGMHFTMTGTAGNAGGKPAFYLTFDDGPHPESTPRLLELLARHDARATFFCLGQNVDKYPAIYDSILAAGHSTGNHTWSHPNGWTTSTRRYMEDVDRAAEVINSKLFRPPYGRLTPGQYRQLKKKYNIIMWTRMFADYHPRFNPTTTNLQDIRPGDILVMHDKPDTVSRTLDLTQRILSSSPYKKTSI